jgi:hypothetical protein
MPHPGSPSRPRNQAEEANSARDFPETLLRALTRDLDLPGPGAAGAWCGCSGRRMRAGLACRSHRACLDREPYMVVSGKDRTQRLIDLICEARSSKAPTRKQYRHEAVPSVTFRAGTRRWLGASRGSLRDSRPWTTPNGAGRTAYPLTWANSEFALFRLWRRPAAFVSHTPRLAPDAAASQGAGWYLPASRSACCPWPGWRAGWPARVCLAPLPARGRL